MNLVDGLSLSVQSPKNETDSYPVKNWSSWKSSPSVQKEGGIREQVFYRDDPMS